MPVRAERSAGVITFHRADDGAPHFLLLDYGRHWDFPKGHLNKGEDDLTAALRELQEETGLARDDIELVPGFEHEIVYFFRDRKKGLIRKTVKFFLAETKRKRITLSHEHSGYEFLPIDQAIERTTFKTAKEVLRVASLSLAGRGPG